MMVSASFGLSSYTEAGKLYDKCNPCLCWIVANTCKNRVTYHSPNLQSIQLYGYIDFSLKLTQVMVRGLHSGTLKPKIPYQKTGGGNGPPPKSQKYSVITRKIRTQHLQFLGSAEHSVHCYWLFWACKNAIPPSVCSTKILWFHISHLLLALHSGTHSGHYVHCNWSCRA